MMITPQRGTKCTCSGCQERYYDLNRTPPVCPKCGVELAPEKPRAVRPVRGAARPARPVAVVEDPVEVEVEVDDADDDDVPEIDEDADDEIEMERSLTPE